jgi:hypothetical protein
MQLKPSKDYNDVFDRVGQIYLNPQLLVVSDLAIYNPVPIGSLRI